MPGCFFMSVDLACQERQRKDHYSIWLPARGIQSDTSTDCLSTSTSGYLHLLSACSSFESLSIANWGGGRHKEKEGSGPSAANAVGIAPFPSA